jgi:hypothetical protein
MYGRYFMSENQVVDLSALLQNAPRDCWLALSDDESRIVGRGQSVAQAIEEAKRVGVEDPVIVWSPKTWIPIVLEGNCAE